MVCVEELECEEVPETKVFSLSASEVIFFLVWLGVGGLDTEYIKSSLSSSCTEHESLLSEQAAESVVASEWSVLKQYTKKQILSGKPILRILGCTVDQLRYHKSKDFPICSISQEWLSHYCLAVSNDRSVKESYESNGPLYPCYAFPTFSFKQKINCTAWFIVVNLVNMWSLITIRCKLTKIWDPKLAKFYEEMYARGNACPLAYTSL